jgi:hypothetical protein
VIVHFTYVLHDTDDQEGRCEQIQRTATEPLTIDDELADKIGRPFYEVVLHCALDTMTGAVTIERATT